MASSPSYTLTFQPPPGPLLHPINLLLPASSPLQSNTIPQTLKDSLTIREQVFVHEQQNIPLQHHIDTFDAISCHWVLNADSIPIGTIRLVPPPHHPHPKSGERFEAPGEDVLAPDSKVLFNVPLPESVQDRKTDLHVSVESYIKLGRLCLIKEFRGKRLANLMIQGAFEWVKRKENRGIVGGESEGGQEWRGLVCVHALEEAVKTWKRNGFVVDEGMGGWSEAGLPHVGMFCRLQLE